MEPPAGCPGGDPLGVAWETWRAPPSPSPGPTHSLWFPGSELEPRCL